MYKILAFNFHSTHFPPSTGGELRYYYFYKELSRYVDVTLLCPQCTGNQIQEIGYSQTFREIRIPHEHIHHQLHTQLHRTTDTEYSGLALALASNLPTTFHQYFNELYTSSDLVIHDHPYMLGYDLYFGLDSKPRIYNSYNFEAALVRQLWTAPGSEKYIQYISELEERLVQKSDLVFAISDEEKAQFMGTYQVNADKIILAPNGIIPDQWVSRTPSPSSRRPTAFFIGSKHPPNETAVNYIIHNLADQCPEIDFLIAGDCCNPFNGVKKGNVRLLGRIDDDTKMNLFAHSDIAINPMFIGAGTNLKTLEYLSAGVPLISTSIGTRGLDLIDGVHYVTAEHHNFAQKLQEAIRYPDRLSFIANKGKALINNNYSWEKITDRVSKEMIELISSKRHCEKTIVILHDCQVSNPMSGRSERLYHLGKHLSKHYRLILLGFTHSDTIVRNQITPSFTEILIPKTIEHIQEDARIQGQHHVRTSDIVNSYMALKNQLLVQTARNLYSQADAVVLSNPYMCLMLQGMEGKPVIYERMHHDFELQKSMLADHPQFHFLIQQMNLIEQTSRDKSSLIITASDEETQILQRNINNSSIRFSKVVSGKEPIELNPLYDASQLKHILGTAPIILFIGSAHPANVEALGFINQRLAPEMSHCKFMVIGSVCMALKGPKSANLMLFHTLDESYKNVLMRIADIGINPMSSGSGSNQKILDYIANKIPTISTPMGARGYPIVNGEHALLCGLEDFRDYVELLLHDQSFRVRLISSASRLVSKHLKWSDSAGRFGDQIESLIGERGHSH